MLIRSRELKMNSSVKNDIKLICPKCGTEQIALIFKNDIWDNVCFYCGYIFWPEDLCKALEDAGWKNLKMNGISV